MDFSNIEALMQATAKSQYVDGFWGFEFTNEIVPGRLNPKTWADDMIKVKSLMKQIFGDAKLPIPGLVGPDGINCPPLVEVVSFVPSGTVDAFTYHQYPQCVAPFEKNGLVLDVNCLNSLDVEAINCSVAVTDGFKNKEPAPAVWVGESADHSGGGIPGLTDTFRSSFYYAWQLGALPLHGVELVARQTLSGGDYELLQRTNFAPNPDYYIIWFFKQLIGGGATVYPVYESVRYLSSGVRVFAFSASQASSAKLTLIAINLQDGTAGGPIEIILPSTVSGFARTEYHLTGDPAVQHGQISCNGKVLTYAPLPSINSLGVPGSGPVVVLRPSSIAFVTIQ
jgi:hypothetical protein